jgi:hypothetical protein
MTPLEIELKVRGAADVQSELGKLSSALTPVQGGFTTATYAAGDFGRSVQLSGRQAMSVAANFAQLGATGEMSIGQILRQAVALRGGLGIAGAAGTAAFAGVAAAAAGTGFVIKRLIDLSKDADQAWVAAGAKAQGFSGNLAIGLGIKEQPRIVVAVEFDFTAREVFDRRLAAAKKQISDAINPKSPSERVTEWATEREQEIARIRAELVKAREAKFNAGTSANRDTRFDPELQQRVLDLKRQLDEKVRQTKEETPGRIFEEVQGDRERRENRESRNRAIQRYIDQTKRDEEDAQRRRDRATEQERTRREGIESAARGKVESAWTDAGRSPRFAGMDEAGSVGAWKALRDYLAGGEQRSIVQRQLAATLKQTELLQDLIQRNVKLATVSISGGA